MKYLFDYGEGFLCCLPVFIVMSMIFATLIWNNLPSRTKKKANEADAPDGH